jgi:GAF domain-containing protein
MRKQILNYENLIRITKAIGHSRDPEEIALMAVEAIKTGMDAKGCALFLFDKKSKELKVAASYGLSQEYLDKGPVSALKSIASSLEEGPVAVFDVTEDPRIQYPEAAQKEGIASILSVPIIMKNHVVGALRVYTAEPWEFTIEDVNYVQALAQIVGMAIEMSRLYQGQREAIEVMKSIKHAEMQSRSRRTPFEGVPVSVSASKVGKKEASV